MRFKDYFTPDRTQDIGLVVGAGSDGRWFWCCWFDDNVGLERDIGQVKDVGRTLVWLKDGDNEGWFGVEGLFEEGHWFGE